MKLNHFKHYKHVGLSRNIHNFNVISTTCIKIRNKKYELMNKAFPSVKKKTMDIKFPKVKSLVGIFLLYNLIITNVDGPRT